MRRNGDEYSNPPFRSNSVQPYLCNSQHARRILWLRPWRYISEVSTSYQKRDEVRRQANTCDDFLTTTCSNARSPILSHFNTTIQSLGMSIDF